MTQLNTPYPATAYLAGFLRLHAQRMNLEVTQADPALELFLEVFSRQGLERVLADVEESAAEFGTDDMPESVAHFLAHGESYIETVDSVVRFLQGKDPSLALRIAGRELIPEGPRFAAFAEGGDDDGSETLAWAFGALGTTDQAKYIASLYVDDLGDVLRDGVDSRFELSRYAEHLAASAPSFDPLQEALDGPTTLIDDMLDDLTEQLLEAHQPDVVGLTVPFPGNVYAAFRMARTIKLQAPNTCLILGGGYVNTELRELSEPRVFDFFDYVTLDDGERPLLALLSSLQAGRASSDRA